MEHPFFAQFQGKLHLPSTSQLDTTHLSYLSLPVEPSRIPSNIPGQNYDVINAHDPNHENINVCEPIHENTDVRDHTHENINRDINHENLNVRDPNRENVNVSDSNQEKVNASDQNIENVKTIEEQVKEILGNDDDDDEVDKVKDRDKDLKRIRELKQNGCGCHMKCDEQFTEELMLNYILDIREMERSHRDMIIMNCISECSDTYATKRGKKRQRMSYEYSLEGRRICRTIFMLVFDIGKKRLSNLLHHFTEYGAVPRIHGNLGKKPVHTIQPDDVKYAIQFITNYADEFGLPQPGAPGGSSGPHPIYLPNDHTKKHVHEKYDICCCLANVRAIKYSSFGKLWYALTRHIKVSNNKDDVCTICETLKKAIKDSSTDEVRRESEEELRNHVVLAQKGGELYGACVEEARDTYLSNVYDKYIHYTFGFCQNINLPHRSTQIGPVYFTALRKVQMFGFRIDGLPKQLNFLIDENETIGLDGAEANGPNAVISMIDWALDRYGQEKRCAFHGDNCLDQNKNWLLVAYFTWRVMTRRQDQVELMMQVPGHVHTLVESAFSSIKQMYRSSDCETMDQLEALVSSASLSNEAIRYPAWKWRDWESFLTPVFKELQGIRNFHYFRFSSAEPGVVTTRNAKDEESRSNILHREDYQFGTKMPVEIQPAGLSKDRMSYLYKKVRPFVHPSFQDLLCPNPDGQNV